MVRKDDTKRESLFDNLITLEEFLEMTRHAYSKPTVYRWVGKGMPHRKIGGKLWFPKKEVELWLLRSS